MPPVLPHPRAAWGIEVHRHLWQIKVDGVPGIARSGQSPRLCEFPGEKHAGRNGWDRFTLPDLQRSCYRGGNILCMAVMLFSGGLKVSAYIVGGKTDNGSETDGGRKEKLHSQNGG